MTKNQRALTGSGRAHLQQKRPSLLADCAAKPLEADTKWIRLLEE